ncbi:MAG: mevalonate kinase [Anaerolineales bacterium]|nr:mevalonate kinase [Anaerolineales bacterium]MDW8162792.1 mevalonate kinase [Anaerolineales bacterium]
MPAFTAQAPAKIILFGEHAVVYGRPAIAVPVTALHARAIVRAELHAPHGQVRLIAPAVQLDAPLDELSVEHPLRRVVELTARELGAAYLPSCQIAIHSTIPPASGLGSGAAVSVAVVRALAAYLGKHLPDEVVSAIAYEVEKIYHGTPSGVDNTVIAFQKAIFFARGKPIQPLHIGRPFTLLIADSGISSPTAITVADVRAAWGQNPEKYEAIFDQIAAIVVEARTLIERGEPDRLGALMTRNQSLLRELGVSSPELDRLIEAALRGGALGAKLSGGGRGGNIIALVSEANAAAVARSLEEAGAVRVISTTVR